MTTGLLRGSVPIAPAEMPDDRDNGQVVQSLPLSPNHNSDLEGFAARDARLERRAWEIGSVPSQDRLVRSMASLRREKVR